jgi:lipopolysaccharide transport system permease protein
VTIEAGRGEARYWRDVWQYRELLYFLAWRDVLVRYKQTAAGVAWAVLRPALTLAVFSVVFGRIARLPSEGVPYPLLVFAGLLPWQFVASSVADTAGSLVSNAGLLTKVYFPRLLAPVSAVAVSVLDGLVSLGLLVLLMAYYGRWPGSAALGLPLVALLALTLAIGAGIWLAALNVRYRDVRLLVPFLVQVGLYVSPVGFSSSLVPERFRVFYFLNPLVGIIDGFRHGLLGTPPPDPRALALSALVALVLLVTGVAYFRHTERTFADVI